MNRVGGTVAIEGNMLEQNVNLTGPLGLAYERSVGFYKPAHAHERLMWIFPRGACQMEVNVFSDSYPQLDRARSRLRVRGGTVAAVPAGVRHDDRSTSSVYDTVALYPSEQLLSDAGVQRVPQLVLAACSPWLSALVCRYFDIRVAGHHVPRDDVAALEREIVRAVHAAISSPQAEEHAGAGSQQTNGADVLAVIEANLFQPISMRSLAERMRMSTSTLTREFRKRTGTTPYAYIRGRRLDEAKVLLRLRKYQVQEVAMMVGYEDATAFSKAFRQRFGHAPYDA